MNLSDRIENAPRWRAETKHHRELAKRLRALLRVEKDKGLGKDRIRILDLQEQITRHVREAQRFDRAAKGETA